MVLRAVVAGKNKVMGQLTRFRSSNIGWKVVHVHEYCDKAVVLGKSKVIKQLH